MTTDEIIPGFPDRFAKALFSRHPDWTRFVTPPNLDWQDEDDLAVEVPSRFAPLCPLRIETMSEGIILNWVGWHNHYDDESEHFSEDQFVDEALGMIDGLLAETLVVIIDWVDGPGGSGHCRADELDRTLEGFWWPRITAQRQVAVISWKGAYDRGPFDPTKVKPYRKEANGSD